jgi:signal peptidase II
MQEYRRKKAAGVVVSTRLKFLLLFLFLVIADQVSKLAVASHFPLYSSTNIIGDILRLSYVRNPGAAFSLSFGNPHIILVVTIIVILFLAFLIYRGIIRPENISGKIALVMIFSGAIGNLIDRIWMGEVTDFIDMGIGAHRWPVYNLADIYVTVGMFILFISYALMKEKPNESEHTPVQIQQ